MRKLVAPLILIALAGCSRETNIQGVVTAKRFEPAHTDMVMMPITTTDGHTTTMTVVPMFFHEPNRWILTVEKYDSNGDPLPVKRYMVQESIYQAAEVGKWIHIVPENFDHSRAKRGRKE